MKNCTYCGGSGCSECDLDVHWAQCKDRDCRTCGRLDENYEDEGGES